MTGIQGITGNPTPAMISAGQSSKFSGVQASAAVSRPDHVQFRGKENETPEADNAAEQTPEASTSKKIMQGSKEATRAIFNKNGLIDDAGWIGLLSVILFMIPGHQVLSVPIILGIGGALRAFGGFVAGFSGERYEQGSFFLNQLKRLGIGGGKNQTE